MKEYPITKSTPGRFSKEMELLELQEIEKVSSILVDKLREAKQNFVEKSVK